MKVVSRKATTRSASKPTLKPRAKDADVSELGRKLLTLPRLNAWGAFLTAHKALENILSRELESACGLPLTWFDALAQLRMAPAQRLTMTQLASALLFSKSGLTRLIDRMVEARLVQRLARPGDRRSLHIALTDAGEEKYRQALPIHLEHVKRHFAAYIEDGEAAAVESALVRMANAVRRESGL
ncbi:MAG TPA: MarR family transcriptional regulator [Methylomirabilota bacterium]|nr:MarR family transcriptional regulator [Methylomirabilota bacterium]